MSDLPQPRNPVASAVARLAIQIRHGAPQSVLDDLRRDLAVAKLERDLRAAVAAEPALTVEQRKRLARILYGGAR